MRAALIALLVLATGCTTRQRIAGGAVGVTAVGIALTFSTEAREDESTQGKVGIAMVLTGLVTLFVVAAIDETASKEPPKEIKVAVTPEHPELSRDERAAARSVQQRRDQAWTLTKQAQEAARANDCAKVTELSAQVGALDAEFYSDVFMKDVAVQRCFTPAPTPAQPAPPVPPPVPPTPPAEPTVSP